MMDGQGDKPSRPASCGCDRHHLVKSWAKPKAKKEKVRTTHPDLLSL